MTPVEFVLIRLLDCPIFVMSTPTSLCQCERVHAACEELWEPVDHLPKNAQHQVKWPFCDLNPLTTVVESLSPKMLMWKILISYSTGKRLVVMRTGK